MPALNGLAAAAGDWLRAKAGPLIEAAGDWLRAKAGPLIEAAGDWLRAKARRLIEAVDPAPEADGPRVPLDTLLDDAGESGVAAGPDRAAVAGPGAPRSSC